VVTLIGKCPPARDEFETVEAAGFDGVELYLERRHLDAFERTLAACRVTPLDVEVVHTPHVTLDDAEYFARAFDLAADLDAFVLVHSSAVPLADAVREVPADSRDVPHGYENGIGDSTADIRATVLDADESPVLDVAHLYATDPSTFEDDLTALLADHADRIGHVHVTDATVDEDHHQIGEGDVPMELVADRLDRQYDGLVTLELMPPEQATARERFGACF